MNIHEYYEDISILLTEVLNSSGLRDDLRWQKINAWLQIEHLARIIEQIPFKSNITLHYFGSQVEGTTTNGLLSDIDGVVCLKTEVVLDDLQFWEASPDTTATFLMVSDESTHPGYVKLQLVQRDSPILVNNYQDDRIRLDSKHRSVLCNNTAYSKSILAHDYHGPASRIYSIGFTADAVIGLHTRCWSYQASQWLSRSRRFNWPPRQIIDVIQETGSLLVPVGHKLSPEQHLEWRLSFSFGEKLLTWKFNSTQYKCYVMLKFIKNTFINVDARDYLTSYHLKTCVFYLIEKTPDSLWCPNHLLFCIDTCLRLLLSWVECNNCPNYFIPEENMFLGRLSVFDQGHIAGILHDLLRQNGNFIKMITYENIGENFSRVCLSHPIELDYPDAIVFKTTLYYLAYLLNFACISVVTNRYNPNVVKSSHGPKQEAVNIVRSLFYSSLGNHLASQSLEQEIHNQEKLIMAHDLLLRGSSSDLASGNLKLAAFYLAQSNLNAMEDVLNQVDAKLTHSVLEFGDIVLDKTTLSKIPCQDISIENLVQQSFALTVIYGLLDIHIIPKVLVFEIFRSTGSERCVDTLIEHWIPIAVVRPRLYLYFLQYQCYFIKGRSSHTSVALSNMIWISKCKLDDYLCCIIDVDVCSRPEFSLLRLASLTQLTSALNLLAYCLRQYERPRDAFNILSKSMKLKNQHNAAKWQIATFINSSGHFCNGRLGH